MEDAPERAADPVPGPRQVLTSAPALAAGIYVAVATLWGLSGYGAEHARTKISDLLPLPLEIAAVFALVVAARQARPVRERRAWGFLAAALAVYGLGDLVWAVLEVGLGQDPFPSVADIGYLLYYPLVAMSLLHFARRPVADVGQRARAALDVATVVVGGFIVVYYLFLGPTLTAEQPSWLAKWLSVAYPMGDIFLLFAVATLLRRGATSVASSTLVVLIASQAAFFLGDLGFGAASSGGTYSPGSWIDSMWLLALGLIIVAAHSRAAHPDADDGHSHVPPLAADSRLPYLSLIVGYGVVGWVAIREVPFQPVGGLLLSALVLTSTVVARQISALRENAALVAALDDLAATDSLTGLTSRRRFFEAAPAALEQSRSRAQPAALLMIDVDHFKTINDALGHATGDEALQRVAAACQELVPAGSIVARYGGDEIIAVLPNTDAPFALAHAERIQREVNRIRLAADPVRTLTVSVGVASLRGDDDLDSLAARADSALLLAKGTGRARVLGSP